MQHKTKYRNKQCLLSDGEKIMSTKTQKYIFTGKLAGVATPMIHNQLIVEASVSDALCTALSMIDNVAFDFELKLNERKDIKIDGTRIDVTVTATKLPDAATIMGTLFKNRSAQAGQPQTFG